MHEVRVMCNGHKNSIRTKTCGGGGWIIVVVKDVISFPYGFLYFIGFGSRLALRYRMCFGERFV